MRVQWKEVVHHGTTGKAMTVKGLPYGTEWVAWEQAQYVPCLNLGGPWFTTEWMETGGTEPVGYNYEPIHDKKNQFSKVSVVDESKVHATIEWEYNLINTLGRSFLDGTIGREEHTIHPSGCVARRLLIFPGYGEYGGPAKVWENFETIFLNPPGVSPVDYLEERVATFMNLNGDSWDFIWEREKFCAKDPSPWRYLCTETKTSSGWDEIIVRIHLKGYPDVFAAFPQDQERFPHHEVCPECGGDHPLVFLWHDYPLWLHWPCYSSTDFIVARDAKPEDIQAGWTHSSVTSGGPFYDFGRDIVWNPREEAAWYFLYGLAPETDEELRNLVRSWLYPALVEDPSNRLSVSYDLGRMVYVLDNTGPACTVNVQPSPVVVSPLFECRNWAGGIPEVLVVTEGNEPEVVPQVDLAGDRLFIYIPGTFTNRWQLKIEGSRP